MRVNLGKKSALYPMVVLIIATYNDDGSVNAMNAAWGGISDTNEIGICLAMHKSTENILKRKAFTVSMATAEMIEACDYVGLVSGNEEPDKVLRAGFSASPSEFVDAPILNELPLTLECEFISYDKSGHLFGSIKNISADESILTDGKIDLKKFHPVILDGFNHEYRAIGDMVAEAFLCGNKFKY